MAEHNFSAKKITSSQAIEHFKNCEDGTLYHNPEFIDSVIGDVIWLGGFKKNSLLCTMPVFNNIFPDYRMF